jgi:hypothetical protein
VEPLGSADLEERSGSVSERIFLFGNHSVSFGTEPKTLTTALSMRTDKSTQSFKNIHKNRVYVHIYMMNAQTNMITLLGVVVLLDAKIQRVSRLRARLTDLPETLEP